MKHFFFVLPFLIFTNSFSQTSEKIRFGVSVTEAVDKWVVFDKRPQDSSHVFGFVYIDQEAGFSFRYTSDLVITDNDLYLSVRDTSSLMIVRLQPRDNVVGILSKEQLEKLGLELEPEWLSFYKPDPLTTEYLTSIGYHYNHAGASKYALHPLEKAYKMEPHFEGLEFELAFAYNATQDYPNAIKVLTKAIENNSKNIMFYRELGYSYMNLGDLKKTEEIYKKGLEIDDQNNAKTEMALNMAIIFFQKKNRAKFDEWAERLKYLFNETTPRLYTERLKFMESQW